MKGRSPITRAASKLAEAHFTKGVAFHEQGKLGEAMACYQQALACRPDDAVARNNLGAVYQAQGKWKEALACFQEAARLKPDYVDAHKNLGAVHQLQGTLEDAVVCYREVLRLRPDYAEIYNNLGICFDLLGREEEAIACFQDALAFNVDYVEAQSNLGLSYYRRGKLEMALSAYEEALRIKPDFADARLNIAVALRTEGRLHEAMDRYREVIRLKPDSAEGHLGLAVGHLLVGNFAEGWPEYEWRRHGGGPTVPVRFAQPAWDGSRMPGRTLLVRAEQGLGDALQFIRYVSIVKERVGRVVVEAPPSLVRLLKTCPGVARVIPQGQALGPFDVHVSLLSLPGILGTTLTTIPAIVPYLSADPKLAQAWHKELSGSRAFKVGIAWQGNPQHPQDRWRSIPLRHFAHLAGIAGVQLFSLQTGPGRDQLSQAAGRFAIADLGTRLNDFVETAALITNLDLVITADTALAHLAGALGKSVWTAVPLSPDWRWLLDREDSPWYPTMRLFRQTELDDWDVVFQRIASELTNKVNNEVGTVHPVIRVKSPDALTDIPRLASPGLSPQQVEVAITTALQQHRAGQLAQAEQGYRDVLKVVPSHPDALQLLGMVAFKAGRTALAIAYLRKALRYQPDFTIVHNNLSSILAEQGNPEEAIPGFREAIRLKPDYADAHNNLGCALKDLGKMEEAAASYREAIRYKPTYAEAHNNLAVVLQRQGNMEEAAACSQEAIRLDPNFAGAYLNLGIALKEMGRAQEGAVCQREAIRLKPDYAEAYNNLAVAIQTQGLLAEAFPAYREAIRLKPDYPDAHFNYSFALLLGGNFAEGWREYEWRKRRKDFSLPSLDVPKPIWDGSSLDGRTILVVVEQGLGDTLQFLRYLPMLKQRGGRVIFACQKALLRLAESCPAIEKVITDGSPIPYCDVYAPLLSLPGIVGTTLETIPAAVPYVTADANLVEQWGRELNTPSPPAFKVGIVWQGSTKFTGDRLRSIPLKHYTALARVRGARFFSLQKTHGLEQLPLVADQMQVVELGSRLEDMMATAAVMKNLNLVITSCTSIAHLAGALAVPVWVALSYNADWRWLLDRKDSPWYPTMRLFRQRERGNWDELFERIAHALEQEVAGRRVPNLRSPVS